MAQRESTRPVALITGAAGGLGLINTVTHPVVTWSAFNASVIGLCTLVQTAAAELRDHGITVNALLPNTIDTPHVHSWLDEADAHKWVSPRSLLFGISFAVAGVGTWPGCYRRHHSCCRTTESSVLPVAWRDRFAKGNDF
jgi:NAD(P)-dependent dehydrogenase (short-subunit alcohol dehydrogenase family)